MMFRVVLIFFVLSGLMTGCHSDDDRSDVALCAKHYKAESYQVAARKCLSAAEAGDINSQWILANLHSYGLIGEKDMKTAVVWFEKAAQNGHTAAQRELGKSYLRGKGVERDIDASLKWLKLAAREGDSDAEFFIGVIYLGNREHKGDQVSAMNWFKKAAAAGHRMAINNLAWLYATSPNKSIRNGEQAIKIMAPLIKKSPESSIFIDTLAAAYAETQNYEKAVELQLQAINYLSKDTPEDEKKGYIQRLEQYQKHQPFREEQPLWGEESGGSEESPAVQSTNNSVSEG